MICLFRDLVVDHSKKSDTTLNKTHESSDLWLTISERLNRSVLLIIKQSALACDVRHLHTDKSVEKSIPCCCYYHHKLVYRNDATHLPLCIVL